jgi:hypothetical protein
MVLKFLCCVLKKNKKNMLQGRKWTENVQIYVKLCWEMSLTAFGDHLNSTQRYLRLVRKCPDKSGDPWGAFLVVCQHFFIGHEKKFQLTGNSESRYRPIGYDVSTIIKHFFNFFVEATSFCSQGLN